MTNTQTKIARLTKRVERIERALAAVEILADPYLAVDAPIAHQAWSDIKAIVREIKLEASQ